MARLPERPNFEHLKKQAKDLLRGYRARDPQAYDRFRAALPAARGKDDDALAALALTLRDAQSCIAREYGLPAWSALKNYVDWRNAKRSSAREHAVPLWLHAVYGHDGDRPRPEDAARMLAERPDLGRGDLFLACASGDEAAVAEAIAGDPSCVNRTRNDWRCPGCKRLLDMPPLVAVTHSSLLAIPGLASGLRRCARRLLDAGADPNQRWSEGDHSLTALYGAAGKNGDEALTALLLEAGADPNDGESLYHSIEHPDRRCARRLLEAGAVVEGTNALQHMLDRDDLEGLKLLLAHTKDANDPQSAIARPLIWAIRRRRSLAHVEALLAAGADPRARTNDGTSAYRFALEYGLTEVAERLAAAGGAADEPTSATEDFVAACARADERAARAILARRPDVLGALTDRELRQLPNLVEARKQDAVRLMVELGWPIAARGGDWNATALNHAVYQGDAELARFLLEHGARWNEPNAFGDVNGILAWASRNQPKGSGDWVGCARALVEHGMPLDLYGDYGDDVDRYLDSERAARGRTS